MTDATPDRIDGASANGRLERLRADGVITGGMIPKLETCIAAVEGGVEEDRLRGGLGPTVEGADRALDPGVLEPGPQHVSSPFYD